MSEVTEIKVEETVKDNEVEIAVLPELTRLPEISTAINLKKAKKPRSEKQINQLKEAAAVKRIKVEIRKKMTKDEIQRRIDEKNEKLVKELIPHIQRHLAPSQNIPPVEIEKVPAKKVLFLTPGKVDTLKQVGYKWM